MARSVTRSIAEAGDTTAVSARRALIALKAAARGREKIAWRRLNFERGVQIRGYPSFAVAQRYPSRRCRTATMSMMRVAKRLDSIPDACHQLCLERLQFPPSGAGERDLVAGHADARSEASLS